MVVITTCDYNEKANEIQSVLSQGIDIITPVINEILIFSFINSECSWTNNDSVTLENGPDFLSLYIDVDTDTDYGQVKLLFDENHPTF